MQNKDFRFILSFIAGFMGVASLLCIPYAIYYGEPVSPFIIPASILIILGLFLYRTPGKNPEAIISKNKCVVLINISWLLLILAGTLPYLISRAIPSLSDVFFETVSGFTTTGSTIFSTIEELPKSILFWRSLTHWIGGIATITLIFTALILVNPGGYDLFVIKRKTTNNLRHLIFQISIIYFGMTFLQVLLLLSGGMNLFESLCHSFGTVSTGSFSPKNNSIADYSPYLQYIMALFMLLSGFSYIIYFQLFKGKIRKLITNQENLAYILIIVAASLFFTVALYFKNGTDFWTTFRAGFFQTVSFISSSGYYTTNYLSWPLHLLPLVYLFIFIGGSTGSSSGGIKISRFLILLKNLKLQFHISDNSEKAPTIKYNKKIIGESPNLSVLTFITVFGFLFVIGTIVLSLFGTDLETCVFLSISALSTFGSNIDVSTFPEVEKLILSFLMIAGRLEIFPLFLLLFPLFNKQADSKLEQISQL